MEDFTHVEGGKTSMVDVGGKPEVHRTARAGGRITLRERTVAALEDTDTEVFATARIAAIRAVKHTWEDIPMCHQIPITDISVEFEQAEDHLTAEVSVETIARTGTEMEALNGVTRALLTIWDMVKATEKTDQGQYPDTRIEGVRVMEKRKAES